MKTHYLSPYIPNEAKQHFTMCGKLVSDEMDLANDPSQITCKTCLRCTLDYFESYQFNLYKELSESVRTMSPKPVGDHEKNWIVSDIKIRGMRATLSFIDRAQRKIDLMRERLKAQKLADYESKVQG